MIEEKTCNGLGCIVGHCIRCPYDARILTQHILQEKKMASKTAIIRLTKTDGTYFVTVEYDATGIQVGQYSSLKVAADYADRHLQLVSQMFGIRAEIVLGNEN